MDSILNHFTTHDWPFISQSDHQSISIDLKSTSRIRKQMPENLFFFDRLLLLASISDYKSLYPPANLNVLQSLLHSIDTCPFDSLKKYCLIYYLLKEYGDKREDAFASDKLIPAHFTTGIDALWALDHSMWQLAIHCFASPTVTPDFIPEIMLSLATLPPIKQRAKHLLSFYQLVNPTLDLHTAILVLRAMSASGQIRTAWSLQRSFQRPDRDQLIHTILASCFGLNDHAKPYSSSLQILSSFPFDPLEDSILEQFCKSSAVILSQNHAMVAIHFYLNKLTGEARYIEAIRFEQGLASSNSIQNDPDVDRVIKGIKDMLPDVQRTLLELELDELNSSKSRANLPTTGKKSGAPQHYDIGRLAWDSPIKTPDLPAPTSLAEARKQQEIRNKGPQTTEEPHSLPLSASPYLRRVLPSNSTPGRSESQKTLLTALALHPVQNTPSKLSSQVIMSGMIAEEASDQAQTTTDTMMTSPSQPVPTDLEEHDPRGTPRFKHFVGPARLPLTKASTASTPAAVPRSKHDASPFHRIVSSSQPSQPTNLHASTSQPVVQERFPTRIAFTPRRPVGSRKSDLDRDRETRRTVPVSQPPRLSVAAPQMMNPSTAGGDESSDEEGSPDPLALTTKSTSKNTSSARIAHRSGPVKKKSRIDDLPVSTNQISSKTISLRRTAIHPSENSRVEKNSLRDSDDHFQSSSQPNRSSFVLPGSFDDQDMHDGTNFDEPVRSNPPNPSRVKPKEIQSTKSTQPKMKVSKERLENEDVITSLKPIGRTPRKRVIGSQSVGKPIISTQPPGVSEPMTPRRSTRLNSNTLSQGERGEWESDGEEEEAEDDEDDEKVNEKVNVSQKSGKKGKSVRSQDAQRNHGVGGNGNGGNGNGNGNGSRMSRRGKK
ncbi:nuclear pore complex assembly-domain-containing protein [Melampsora americana]|nr:nuclear pore complex assembly-domain-containing protein [Melampsora americana]